MNGELLPVWSRTWSEIWSPLSKRPGAPGDLFMELTSGLAAVPREPAMPIAPSVEAFGADGELIDSEAIQARSDYEEAVTRYSEDRKAYEAALNSEEDARSYFRLLLKRVPTEADAVRFLERSYEPLTAYGDHELIEHFRQLVRSFLQGFSLRYELRGQFSLHTTIPGVFTKLISELRNVALADAHLAGLLEEFEESFADLRASRTQARMKTCLQKQFNILEAFGRKCPNVTATTLGAICDQLDWPHEKIKEVGKNLYKFGSDYPGVRHGGTPSSALRSLEMKDFICLSLMLASFTPYVASGLDSERCYDA